MMSLLFRGPAPSGRPTPEPPAWLLLIPVVIVLAWMAVHR